ncbi:DUF1269 domain-containing protein [Pleionea mediterranea]|uniref:DUF1269 domain-containing protein n=1 Tax=Pleionea mediterranea TaxID=523701 RepID=A0A316FLZ6_9GAMM|nr:DUF1269 domain-containing protein [Pleionea mediterranea]PWK49908.1 hypothetical protein C8D97_10770 [Pleionea mediterranea]
MIRLYFLVPDFKNTQNIVNELQDYGLDEHHIHIVGKDHERLEKAHLHEAGLAETTDLIPALKRGLLFGGTTGFLAGIVAITFPPAGLVFGGGAVLGLSAAGAGFGAWMSSMIGVSVNDLGVEHFQKQIDQGKYLLLVDVERDLFKPVEELVRSHHPEADIEWVDLKGTSIHYANSMN